MSEDIKQLLGTPIKEQDTEIEYFNYNNEEEHIANPINNDSSLKQENVLDRRLNRWQRYLIAKKIFLMMICEVFVIGILISSIAIIPYLNAFSPIIIVHFPPAFLTLSLIIGYCFLVRYINMLPNFKITMNTFHIKKTTFKTNAIFKSLCIFLFVIYLNVIPRETYTFNFSPIELNNTLVQILFGTGLAVFTKTTILGKDIIKTLYELMKQHNLN